MQITLTRYNGGIHISPAPTYLLAYLRYSHRGIEFNGRQSGMSYETRLLYSVDPADGSVFTLPGFYQSIIHKIVKAKDSFVVVDERTSMPEPDWHAVKRCIKLRDYQREPVIHMLSAGMEDGGIVNATGGFGA